MTKSPEKSLFVKGGAQGPGRGPKPGATNAGRPNDEFRAFLQGIRDSQKFRDRLAAIADMSDPQLFVKFAQWLVERTDGKPMQEIQTSGEVTVRVVYD